MVKLYSIPWLNISKIALLVQSYRRKWSQDWHTHTLYQHYARLLTERESNEQHTFIIFIISLIWIVFECNCWFLAQAVIVFRQALGIYCLTHLAWSLSQYFLLWPFLVYVYLINGTIVLLYIIQMYASLFLM